MQTVEDSVTVGSANMPWSASPYDGRDVSIAIGNQSVGAGDVWIAYYDRNGALRALKYN